jgi:hypothetical protein
MSLTPNGLADAIESAFEMVWGQLKPDDPFPADGKPDRRVLFRAIARGLLTYLEAHEGDFISTIDLDDIGGGTFDVGNVALDTDLS